MKQFSSHLDPGKLSDIVTKNDPREPHIETVFVANHGTVPVDVVITVREPKRKEWRFNARKYIAWYVVNKTTSTPKGIELMYRIALEMEEKGVANRSEYPGEQFPYYDEVEVDE